jgi:hypothetical protein
MPDAAGRWACIGRAFLAWGARAGRESIIRK